MQVITLHLPTGELDADGKEILKDRTFLAPRPKARMIRRAAALYEEIDEQRPKDSDLDHMINFVVDLFDKQFTLDDVWDGLYADEFNAVLFEVISGVNHATTEKINQLPKNPQPGK